MENLIFSLNATIPIFLMMLAGLLFRKMGLFNDNFVEKMNQFVFKAALPVLEDKAAFEIMGDGRYVTKRSFDVYEGAANNNNGVAGAFAAGGIGAGVGMNVAQAAGEMAPRINPGQMVICPDCDASCEVGAVFGIYFCIPCLLE